MRESHLQVIRSTLLGSSFVVIILFVGCGGTPASLGRGYSAGTTTETCTSGQTWTGGTNESEVMNPGFACRSCHLGNNFQNQNPGGVAEKGKAYFFMGTAYGSVKQADLCAAADVPSGAVVEILDMNDAVQATLTINAAGNFYSKSTSAGFTLPYKARVKANGKTNAMGSAQMDGDCNTCHTATGLNGAPGRVFFPQ